MQKSTENDANSPKLCTLIENRGRRIERRCLNLHLKCIYYRFCACAVQMLLKMAVNAAICSTGLYRCAKFDRNRCISFDNMKLSIFCPFGLKTPIHAPKIGGFGGFHPKMGSNVNEPPKGTSLRESASFEPSIVKIRRRV